MSQSGKALLQKSSVKATKIRSKEKYLDWEVRVDYEILHIDNIVGTRDNMVWTLDNTVFSNDNIVGSHDNIVGSVTIKYLFLVSVTYQS